MHWFRLSYGIFFPLIQSNKRVAAIRSLLRLLRKTTLTPTHICVGISTVVLYIALLWLTYPYGLFGSVLFTVLAGVWSVLIEPRWIQRREFIHRVSSMPIGIQIKLAVVGDLHIGSPYATLDALEKLLDNILSEKPDALVLVGDYVIQGVIGGTHVHITDVVKLLDTVDIPCIAIIGNHDVKDGRADIHAAFQNSSIHFLENTHVQVNINNQPLQFIGLDDESTGHPKPDDAFPTKRECGVV